MRCRIVDLNAEAFELREDVLDAAIRFGTVLDHLVEGLRHGIVGIPRDRVSRKPALRLPRFDDACRDPNGRRTGRHRLDHDSVRTNLRTMRTYETQAAEQVIMQTGAGLNMHAPAVYHGAPVSMLRRVVLMITAPVVYYATSL